MTRQMSPRRQQFYVLVSILYLAIGIVVGVRSVIGHVIPLLVLAAVFMALGLVRLRDYRRGLSHR